MRTERKIAMQAGMVFPIVSKSNGTVVAAHTYEDGAGKVASAVNRAAGAEVVAVGSEALEWDGKGVFTVDGVQVAVNPTYARAKDPHGWALAGIVALATAPKARKRAAKATTAAPAKAKATTGARRMLTPKPTTTAAPAKATTGRGTGRARAKAGATA